MILLKQADYTRYLIAKTIKLSMQTSSDPFFIALFKITKGSGTRFQAKYFVGFFYKFFFHVILHQLAKLHYQTVSTP